MCSSQFLRVPVVVGVPTAPHSPVLLPTLTTKNRQADNGSAWRLMFIEGRDS